MKNARTKSPASAGQARRRAGRGFTLVEVMIGSTLGSMVLVGVLSSFLMIGRSGMRLYFYNDMEAESRRTLEEFAQDVRMASNSVYNSANSVTLTVPDNYLSTANQVTYAFGSVTVGTTTTNNCFYRLPGTTSSTATPTIFIRNVTSCTFTRYDVLGALTTLDSLTKRIELTLLVSNTRSTLVAATDKIISATFLLRNK